jgi:RNA polymerase sigma factor (sigma-70 family)
MEILDRLASHFAWRYHGLHSHDEFMSIGYPRLDQAIRSYDAAKGPFAPYAWQGIHGTMMNVVGKKIRYQKRLYSAGYKAAGPLRDESDQARDGLEQHQEHLEEYLDSILIGMTLGTVGRATGDGSQGEDIVTKRVDDHRAGMKLPAAVSELTPEQQQIVEVYYLSEPDADADADQAKPVTLYDLAELQGVSYGTARRRHKETLATLRQKLRTPSGDKKTDRRGK